MKLPLLVVLILLNISNVILHSFGLYLLARVYRNGNESSQLVFIINLSVCEALMNFLEAVRRVPDLFIGVGEKDVIVGIIQTYILIVMFTGVSLVYYMDMIYLTLDKLFDILLSIKYPIYWNEVKSKWLLGVTWIIGILLSITISLLYGLNNYDWEDAFFKYFFPTLEFAFVLFAIMTYGFIFFRYKATREKPVQIVPSQDERAKKALSCFQVFRQSRFYIVVLLIATFIIFMIIPDLTYLFVVIINKKESEILSVVCWISYAVSNLIDAWIYIFLYSPVRLMLKKILRRSERVQSLQANQTIVTSL